jgi:hypothetical protein
MRVKIYSVAETGAKTLLGIFDRSALEQMGEDFKAALPVLAGEGEVLLSLGGGSVLLRGALEP